MCWCFPFGLSNNKKRKTASSGEKKRRERPPTSSLHGDGVPVVAETQEKRRPRETPRAKKSKETVTPRSPRRERAAHPPAHQPRQDYVRRDAYATQYQYRPALNVQVPHMWYRSVDSDHDNSSQEMLLNPRPHRSPHERQRHPKRSSQSTLRGRGAKRDPPRHSKSKKSMRQETPRQGGWSLFSTPPPKTSSRRDRSYQNLESPPRSHRSPRHQSSSQYQELPHSSQSQHQPRHHHRSRQQQRQPQTTRSARSRTPNTAARRTPDRRFAVLAATNQALEDLRREAFAQPSPPPRRERLQRYQGVTVPTSTIPFNWDCVSSSQTSTIYREPTTQRRHRRR